MAEVVTKHSRTNIMIVKISQEKKMQLFKKLTQRQHYPI